MDAILLTQMLESLLKLEINNALGFFLIFVFIWLQVKSLKKEVKKIGESIENKRLACEKRFTNIETMVSNENEIGFILKPQKGKT